MINMQPREVKVIRATSELTDKNILRVAAYCRVSTDSDDQVNSFIAQVKYYNDFIRLSDGMELVDIYADEGITGTSVSKRDEFKRMIKDSRLGKIDRVYVKSVTRFARNSLECIENIRILKANGTSVFFENDGIDTETMNSEMILYIKSAFAQSEAMSASKRMSTAIRMKMENGTFVNPSVPFGYRMENNKLIVVPEEADIVRSIYNMFLCGMGVNKIINELNGSTASQYALWKRGRVEYILRNERYIGDCLWQKKYTPPVFPFTKKINKGEVDKFYAEGTHEAIIDKATFQKVQLLLEMKSKKAVGRAAPKKHIYSNILYCGDCGCAYKLKQPNLYGYWVCTNNGTAGHKCNSTPVTETEIEKTFVNLYNRLKQNEKTVLQKAFTQITALKKRITVGSESISEIDNEIAQLSDENSMYVRFFQQSMMDEITFREQTGVVNKRINELRVRRQKLLHEDGDEACIELLRETKEKIADMPDAILWFEPVIFSALVSKIYVISKNTLTFELKCGLKLKEKIVWD
ncbi:MAG: recombinase family protein [Clostridiales bacterium]|nr:recombinase family protein [Clostridiales bacterium]